MHLEWPQITLAVMQVMSLTVSILKHGEKRPNNYSFWTAALSTIIGNTILYYGGFWK